MEKLIKLKTDSAPRQQRRFRRPTSGRWFQISTKIALRLIKFRPLNLVASEQVSGRAGERAEQASKRTDGRTRFHEAAEKFFPSSKPLARSLLRLILFSPLPRPSRDEPLEGEQPRGALERAQTVMAPKSWRHCVEPLARVHRQRAHVAICARPLRMLISLSFWSASSGALMSWAEPRRAEPSCAQSAGRPAATSQECANGGAAQANVLYARARPINFHSLARSLVTHCGQKIGRARSPVWRRGFGRSLDERAFDNTEPRQRPAKEKWKIFAARAISSIRRRSLFVKLFQACARAAAAAKTSHRARE